MIPGLFQTPEYARCMLAARPHVTDDEVENLLAARLARQEILTATKLRWCMPCLMRLRCIARWAPRKSCTRNSCAW
jgi:hypothetical protein